jgi:hypothetical protein
LRQNEEQERLRVEKAQSELEEGSETTKPEQEERGSFRPRPVRRKSIISESYKIFGCLALVFGAFVILIKFQRDDKRGKRG